MDLIENRTCSKTGSLSYQLTENSDDAEMIVSYDILECFPILICQYVFHHLNGKDLIQASAVNREWYKLVCEKDQMKKLQFLAKPENMHHLTRKAKYILKNSTRKYQNIEFRDIDFRQSRFFNEFLNLRAGSWRSVSFNRCIVDTRLLSQILHHINMSQILREALGNMRLALLSTELVGR